MNGNLELSDLGNVNVESINKDKYISPELQADALFNFTNQLDFIISPLKNKMISPRYCIEDVSYLNCSKVQKICIPMKCFCDINIHRLSKHMSAYGMYGLAFTKQWGINNGIAPVRYINSNSELVKDFSKAFSIALGISKDSQTDNEKILKNYLAHELMYFKPYSGIGKRENGEDGEKCFMDECEWRYVPDVSKIGFNQLYFNNEILSQGRDYFTSLSDFMNSNPDVSLKFEYSDLKYIIVNDKEDFIKLTNVIDKDRDISNLEKRLIYSKIIIWEESRGDF